MHHHPDTGDNPNGDRNDTQDAALRADPVKAAAVLADAYVAGDLAENMTCREIEALCVLLAHHQHPRAAVYWMTRHVACDDDGDLHTDGERIKTRLDLLGITGFGELVDTILGPSDPTPRDEHR